MSVYDVFEQFRVLFVNYGTHNHCVLSGYGKSEFMVWSQTEVNRGLSTQHNENYCLFRNIYHAYYNIPHVHVSILIIIWIHT